LANSNFENWARELEIVKREAQETSRAQFYTSASLMMAGSSSSLSSTWVGVDFSGVVL